MSLIQEALRRHAEENPETNPTPAADTPSQPGGLPPVPPEQPGLPSRPAKPVSPIWVLILLLLIVAGGGFLVYNLLQDKASTPSRPEPALTATGLADHDFPPTGSAPTATDPVPDAPPIPTVPPAIALTPPDAITTPPEAQPSAQLAGPSPNPAQERGIPASQPKRVAPDASEPGTARVPRQDRPSVNWPRLSVSGVLAGMSGNRGAAIVNQQVVGVGETVMGAKLVAVAPQQVEFEFQGERRVARMGQTIEGY